MGLGKRKKERNAGRACGDAFVISQVQKLHDSSGRPIDIRPPQPVAPPNEKFQFHARPRRQVEFLLHT
jgi:hypothetical protein